MARVGFGAREWGWEVGASVCCSVGAMQRWGGAGHPVAGSGVRTVRGAWSWMAGEPGGVEWVPVTGVAFIATWSPATGAVRASARIEYEISSSDESEAFFTLFRLVE